MAFTSAQLVSALLSNALHNFKPVHPLSKLISFPVHQTFAGDRLDNVKATKSKLNRTFSKLLRTYSLLTLILCTGDL